MTNLPPSSNYSLRSLRILRASTLILSFFFAFGLISTSFAKPKISKHIKTARKELNEGIAQTTKKIRNTNLTPQQANVATSKLHIQGLRGISQKEALLMLGNIADLIVESEISQSRADDVAFLLEQALRQHGYPEAEVSWKIRGTAPNKTVILTVNQGPTRNMGVVKVTGIKEELKPEIAAYFKHDKSSKIPTAEKKIPFIPDNMKLAEENATSYLLSQGYWKAQVKITNQHIHPDSGLVDLDVHVSSGPLYKLSPVKFTGSSPLPLSPLRKKLEKYNQSPANTQNILLIQSQVLEYFLSQGYTLASVNMNQELVGTHAQLTFDLNIGQKYRIGKVTITGLEHTDPFILKRRFDRIVGRPYDPAKMDLNQKKLMASGAFKSVQISNHPNPDGTIDLDLKIKEGQARGISTYLGAGSFEGPIFGIGYHDRNFRGKIQSLAISAEYSGLGILGRASITEPMLFGSDRQLMLSTFLLSHEFDGYKKYELGIGAELIWKLSEAYSIRFYGDALAATVNSVGLPEDALGYQDYGVLRAGITQMLDYRNNPLSPNKGFHGELTTETGAVSGSSVIPYSRLILQASYRQPINDQQYLVFSGQAGTIFNNDSQNFPVDLRYFSGGSNSIRSFPRREMGPTADGNYKGGEAYWVSTIEYNRKVAGPLWTNLFVDAGALSEFAGDLTSTDVELAAGLGFWLNLPIGPIRAEYGYNLTRDSGEPAGTFHFTIGVSF